MGVSAGDLGPVSGDGGRCRGDDRGCDRREPFRRVTVAACGELLARLFVDAYAKQLNGKICRSLMSVDGSRVTIVPILTDRCRDRSVSMGA